MTDPITQAIADLGRTLGITVAAGAALGALLPHPEIPVEAAREKATELLADLTADDLDRIGLAAAELHKLTSWQAAQRKTTIQATTDQPTVEAGQ